MNIEKTAPTAAVSDEDLEKVAGGLVRWEDPATGKHYRFVGNDIDEKFLCPNCKRPLHMGLGFRYYCDPCNESWLFESKLIPNITGGAWKEVSKSDYDGYGF